MHNKHCYLVSGQTNKFCSQTHKPLELRTVATVATFCLYIIAVSAVERAILYYSNDQATKSIRSGWKDAQPGGRAELLFYCCRHCHELEHQIHFYWRIL